MKMIIFILSVFASCSSAEMIIRTTCDEKPMEEHFKSCLLQHDSTTQTGRSYWKQFCAEEARTLYCKKDTVILYKGKIIPYEKATERVKNKITNIQR